jgi:peptidoglycan/LPS O-acetylase OafA/YrhL
VSLRSFYARRVRRLFPALFVVVCVTLLVGAFALLPIFDQQQDLARSAIATATYVSNFYFWLHSPGYFDQSADMEPLLHTWSLSVEEQFYLVWPLLVIAVLRITRHRRERFTHALLVLT